MEVVYCKKVDHYKRQIIGFCTSRGCKEGRVCCTQCRLCDHTYHHIIEFQDPEKDYTDIAALYNKLKKLYQIAQRKKIPNMTDLVGLGKVFAQLGIDDHDIRRVKQKFQSSIASQSLDLFNIQQDVDDSDQIDNCQMKEILVECMEYLNNDEYDLALEACDYIFTNYKSWHFSWYYKALTLFLIKIQNESTTNYEDILKYAEMALKLRPNDLDSLRLKGNILQAMSHPFEARETNAIAILSQSSISTDHYRIGHHYEKLNFTPNQQYRHRQSLNVYY